MNRLFSLTIFAAAASQLGATDCGQAVRDSGFDLWCGDALCAWKIERGDVAKVATWNPGDYGVQLVGDDVAIEQLSPVASSDGACLEMSMIANIDENAQVDLNIDIYGDGSVESTQRLPTARWQLLAYKLYVPGTWGGIRFELAKRGAGQAVLAQIDVKESNGCDGLPPIVPGPAPLGAPCVDDAKCASGMCGFGYFANECVGCRAPSTCPANEVCGFADPTSPVRDLPIECVPAASRALGDNCLFDNECASGICTQGFCSTCRTNSAGCAGGETCDQAHWPLANQLARPWVCSPAQHRRASGQPCASDDDCASSRCAGTPRMQCDDGRSCANASDCPFGGPDTQNPLQNGPCNTVGVQGGSCQ